MTIVFDNNSEATVKRQQNNISGALYLITTRGVWERETPPASSTLHGARRNILGWHWRAPKNYKIDFSQLIKLTTVKVDRSSVTNCNMQRITVSLDYIDNAAISLEVRVRNAAIIFQYRNEIFIVAKTLH